MIGKYIKNLGFLIRYAWVHAKSRYLYAAITIILDSTQPFFVLLMPKYIIDELIYEKRWSVVLLYILLFAGVQAVFALLRSVLSYWNDKSAYKCKFNMSLLFNKYFINMDYGKFEDNSIRNKGEIIGLNMNATNIVDSVFARFFTTLLQLAGYTYIVFTLHPLVIVFIVGLTAVYKKLTNKRIDLREVFQRKIAYFERRIKYLFKCMISFDFGKECRINGASRWLGEKYTAEVDGYAKEYLANQKDNLKLNLINKIGDCVQLIVMYGYCSFKAVTGAVTVGSFSVYLGAITNFTGLFFGFIYQLLNIKFLSHCVDDYKAFVKTAAPTHKARGLNSIDEGGIKHEISFENVSFKYPNTENYVLKNVTLKISTGERLSVVGCNGAGKSTLIKLLCRLYEPTEGVILYNGTDISTINYDSYRKLLAVVFQDFQLFAFSVADNVMLNRPRNEEALRDALDKSGLSGKIAGLSLGADTEISKSFSREGTEFSGGEGQKLACARAYYRDAPIVILDEPTAALDPLAEAQLYERFDEITGGKTAIFISHRLASVRFCDKVAVFEEGRLAEYGTHADLLKKNGIYAGMFEKQAVYYREEVAV